MVGKASRCFARDGFGPSNSSASFQAENAGGNCFRVSSPSLPWHVEFISHPQYKRTQARVSTVPAIAIASEAKVLTVTFSIFLEAHTIGLIGLVWFLPIHSSDAAMIIP